MAALSTEQLEQFRIGKFAAIAHHALPHCDFGVTGVKIAQRYSTQTRKPGAHGTDTSTAYSCALLSSAALPSAAASPALVRYVRYTREVRARRSARRAAPRRRTEQQGRIRGSEGTRRRRREPASIGAMTHAGSEGGLPAFSEFLFAGFAHSSCQNAGHSVATVSSGACVGATRGQSWLLVPRSCEAESIYGMHLHAYGTLGRAGR